MEQYEIDVDMDINLFANLVLKVLKLCIDDKKTIDYDDMIYFPVKLNLNCGKYDYVFCDEAQDLNLSQIKMVAKTVKPGGRIFVICDPQQAIYRFRGADFKFVNQMIEGLNPTKLPLPISYRCPKNVIIEAQKYVPDITPWENAKEGKVEEIGSTKLQTTVQLGDVVISRYNAPLVKYCLRFLKSCIPSNIVGQDIGANFLSFIKKSKAKTIPKFVEYVEKWKQNEANRMHALRKSSDSIVDKAECLIELTEGLSTIKQLQDLINKLFVDVTKDSIVTFSSTHKFKGSEANNIYMLKWTYKDFNEEECNLSYVAITRAKEKLTFVIEDPSDKKKSRGKK
jgi:DNA helicase-2/ATP-dependent DNA helicase PcrA